METPPSFSQPALPSLKSHFALRSIYEKYLENWDDYGQSRLPTLPPVFTARIIQSLSLPCLCGKSSMPLVRNHGQHKGLWVSLKYKINTSFPPFFFMNIIYKNLYPLLLPECVCMFVCVQGVFSKINIVFHSNAFHKIYPEILRS